MQPYSPFRTVLLEREELSRLGELRPLIPVCHTLLHWLFIAAAWIFVAWIPGWWTAAIAVPVIGVNFYGLYIIGHDGLHRRLFADQRANDAWNDLFILGSFGAITRLNRRNHMDHHQDTCLMSDPDRHKYLHAGKDGLVPFLMFLSGLASLVPSVRNVFFDGAPRKSTQSYGLRDLFVLVGWQAALAAGLSWGIGWWAYPLLWIFPVYGFGYRADLTRVFCEHAVLAQDARADETLRLVTYRSNWLEKLFFAPHNMNFHAAHHLWPGIPYYNLPKADRRMRARGDNDPRLVMRSSYIGFLLDYLRWRLHAGVSAPEMT
jgi:fatty acid desaturase